MALEETVKEVRRLVEELQKANEKDQSFLNILNKVGKQVEGLESLKTSFNKTQATIISRSIINVKAQTDAMKKFQESERELARSREETLKRIQEIQKLGDKASSDNLIELNELTNKMEHGFGNLKKNVNDAKTAFEKLSKENKKIIEQFEEDFKEASTTARDLLEENFLKKWKDVGENIGRTLESSMRGGVDGIKQLMDGTFGGINQVFAYYAVKMGQKGKEKIEEIKQLEEDIARKKTLGMETGTDEIRLDKLKSERDSSEGLSKSLLDMSKGFAVLSTSIMGVVGFFQMLIDAEAKVKEFNKDIINDMGSLDFASKSIENLSDGLFKYQQKFTNMSNSIGVKAEDIKSDFTTLAGTEFFNVKSLGGADEFEKIYYKLKTASRSLGLGISEVGELAGDLAHSLAIDVSTTEGVDNISEAMNDIGYYANKSSMATKAFATQMKELINKSEKFNSNTKRTASIVSNLNKILGQRQAKNFLESFEDISGKDTSEVIKKVVLGDPKQIKQIIERDYLSQLGVFEKTLGGADSSKRKLIESAAQVSGINIDKTKPLSKQIAGLDVNDPQVKAFFSEIIRQGEGAGLGKEAPEILSSIKQLGQIYKGTQEDTVLNITKSARSLTMAGQYEVQMSQLEAISKNLRLDLTGALNEAQMEALIKGSEMSRDQVKVLLAIKQNSEGNYVTALKQVENLKQANDLMNKAGATQEEIKKGQEQQEEANKILSSLNLEFKDGALVDNLGNQIKQASDLEHIEAKRIEEQKSKDDAEFKSTEELQAEQIDAVWGLGDRLEATFATYLVELNGYIARILSYVSSWFGSQSNEEMKNQQRLQEEKIKEKEELQKQIKIEKKKISDLNRKKTLTEQEKIELEASKEKLKALEEQASVNEKSLDLLKKGKEFEGSKLQQEKELATATKQSAELEYGKGTTGANIGQLKESLSVSTDRELLNKLDQIRDIFEKQQEGEATVAELKILEDFEKKVTKAGLNLQLDETMMGTEYAKIRTKTGEDLYQSIEGTTYDTNIASTNLEATKTQKNKIASFYKDLGVSNEENLKTLIYEYRQILEQENDLVFNELTEEEKKQKAKIEETLKKHNIKSHFQSGVSESGLSFTLENYPLATDVIGKDSKVTALGMQGFDAIALVKAQTEEDRRNEQINIDRLSKGVQKGLEEHDKKKTELTGPMLPQNLTQAQDFIWRKDSGIQTFSPNDNVIGYKDNGVLGGAVNNTINNKGNSRAVVNININGGNPQEIVKVIQDTMKRVGVVVER